MASRCNPKGNFNYIPVQPEFITSPLMINGVDCLWLDAGTRGAHYSEWMPTLMSHNWSYTNLSSRFTEENLPNYFLSAPKNFERFYGDNVGSTGGIPPLALSPRFRECRLRAHP